MKDSKHPRRSRGRVSITKNNKMKNEILKKESKNKKWKKKEKIKMKNTNDKSLEREVYWYADPLMST